MKRGFLLLLIPSIFVGMIILLTENTIAESQSPPNASVLSDDANTDKNKHVQTKEKEESDEGIVIYQVKYDYDAISSLLELNLDEYNQYWKKGFSIADMAKKQGLSRGDLEEYFYTFHYKEMQKWRAKGLTEEHYFHLVYRLSEEIAEFIDRNPNR